MSHICQVHPSFKIKRDKLWFNPSYSANLKIKVGKIFIRLVDKHFPRHHKYYKLFSRNSIKLSYSCMPNMKNVIRKHSKIVKNPEPFTTKTCNCQRKTDCPMDGHCLSEYFIYKASVSTTTNKYCYDTYENTFKEHYNNHKCSFRSKFRGKNTELFKYLSELKEREISIILLIGILLWNRRNVCGSRKCGWCIWEKALVASADPNFFLDKRDEVVMPT